MPHTPKTWIPQGQQRLTDRDVGAAVEAIGDDWGMIGIWVDRSNEPEENFQLICAAPEMLMALKQIVRRVNMALSPPKLGERFLETVMDEIRSVATESIAKADF